MDGGRPIRRPGFRTRVLPPSSHRPGTYACFHPHACLNSSRCQRTSQLSAAGKLTIVDLPGFRRLIPKRHGVRSERETSWPFIFARKIVP